MANGAPVASTGLRVTGVCTATSFSGDGSKIYTSSASELIQFNLDSLGTEDEIIHIKSSKYDDYSTEVIHGALQRGPNGIIYLAINQGLSVGTISNPSLEGAAANFNAKGFDLLLSLIHI